MRHYVDGKVVVITGGSSGFGLETARLLLEMGARVAITGRDASRLEAAKGSLGTGSNLLTVQADACSIADWKKLVDAVIGHWGAIDVMLFNHGAGVKIANVEDMDDAAMQSTLDINLVSVIRGSREVIPFMKRVGRGHIVVVSSACAHHSWGGWGVYTAAKAGLLGFSKCLHVEMSAWGGKASVFTPGAARTGFCNAAGIDPSWQKDLPEAVDFARTLVHCIDVPDNCFIQEAMIWGTAQVPAMINPF